MWSLKLKNRDLIQQYMEKCFHLTWNIWLYVKHIFAPVIFQRDDKQLIGNMKHLCPEWNVDISSNNNSYSLFMM